MQYTLSKEIIEYIEEKLGYKFLYLNLLIEALTHPSSHYYAKCNIGLHKNSIYNIKNSVNNEKLYTHDAYARDELELEKPEIIKSELYTKTLSHVHHKEYKKRKNEFNAVSANINLKINYKNNDAVRKTYQRLEFLGDKVIGLTIAEVLYKKQSNINEGTLSKLHSFLVKTETISNIAYDLKLGSLIIMANGEEAIGGRQNPRNLENALEAIIGAIFIESGYNASHKVILHLWRDAINQAIFQHDLGDYKSQLQEWSQKSVQCLPEYKVESIRGPQHALTFVVLLKIPNIIEEIRAEGKTKKSAEQQAAKIFLERIVNF